MSKPKAFTADPFGGTAPEAGPHAVCCPVCSSTEFDARQNQYTTMRECRKCGNKWSGGMGGQPDFDRLENRSLVPPPGIEAPDEDLPPAYDGGFRNPSKNFDRGD